MASSEKTQSQPTGLKDYLLHLRDQTPFRRYQATAVGIILVALIGGGIFFAVLTLSSIHGGGNVGYEGKGSPGPVIFGHYAHMWFKDGKYKDCKVCHDKIYPAQKYGTYVLRVLKDSPPRKFRIGKDEQTMLVSGSEWGGEATLVTYDVPRACRTCAVGECHNGLESFSRFECLKCHQRR